MNLATDEEHRAVTEETDALHAQDWDDHGLFKDDPEALQLFDEIEEERDRWCRTHRTRERKRPEPRQPAPA